MTKEYLFFEKGIVNKLIGNINHIKGLRSLLYKTDLSRYIKNDYYRNAYKIWKKNNIIYEPCNFNSIKNDWIYDNILLTNDDGRVFKPPGYYNDERMPLYVPKTFRDLPVQIPLRDLRGIFRNLVPKINMSFYNMSFTNKSQDTFTMGRGENKVEISDGIFRSIYNTILLNNITPIRIWEQKWMIELNKENIDWEQIWLTIHNSTLKYEIQSSIWEMIHRNYICGYILKQMHKTDGICKLCNMLERQRTHIFMKCNIIKSLYLYFNALLLQLDSRNLTEEEMAFGIYEDKSSKISLRNYITFVIRHIVYRNRNLQISIGGNITTILKQKIRYYIQKDLKEKFDIAKINKDVENFKNKYIINEYIGKIQNNEFEITI